MIGIYDSGVGGLAILRAVRGLLPRADLLYLADQANVPYGDRPLDEIRALALDAVGLLANRGATTVVVACNTASAAALSTVREAFPALTIVGMEPAVKPAAQTTRTGVVAVLATPATFEAAGFEELVGRFAAGVEVVAHPCPGWATAVEEEWPDGALPSVRDHLRPLTERNVDTVVLACTHYSFLLRVIEEVMGPTVGVIDPTDPVAAQTARVGDPSLGGTTTFLTTGNALLFRDQIDRLLGWEVETSTV